MDKENMRLTVSLTLLLVPIIFGMFVPFALAQPAADSIGVEHASGPAEQCFVYNQTRQSTYEQFGRHRRQPLSELNRTGPGSNAPGAG